MICAWEEGWFDSGQGHEFFSFVCDIVPKSRMSGAVPSLPYSFVACSRTSLNRLVLETSNDTGEYYFLHHALSVLIQYLGCVKCTQAFAC